MFLLIKSASIYESEVNFSNLSFLGLTDNLIYLRYVTLHRVYRKCLSRHLNIRYMSLLLKQFLVLPHLFARFLTFRHMVVLFRANSSASNV